MTVEAAAGTCEPRSLHPSLTD